MPILSRAQVWVRCEDGLWWPAKVVRPAEDVMASIALNHEDCCVEFYHNPGELYPIQSTDANTVQPMQRHKQQRSQSEEARFVNVVTRNAVLRALRDDSVQTEPTPSPPPPSPPAMERARTGQRTTNDSLHDTESSGSPSPQRPSASLASATAATRHSPTIFSASELRNIHALLGAVEQSTAGTIRNQLQAAGIRISANAVRKQMHRELATQKLVRADHRRRVISIASSSSRAEDTHRKEGLAPQAVAKNHNAHSSATVTGAAQGAASSSVPSRKRGRLTRRASRVAHSSSAMSASTTTQANVSRTAAALDLNEHRDMQERDAMQHAHAAALVHAPTAAYTITDMHHTTVHRWPDPTNPLQHRAHDTTHASSLLTTREALPPWHSRSRTRESDDNSTERATCVSAHVLEVLRKEVFDNPHNFVLSPLYRFIDLLGAVSVDNGDIVTRLPAPSALREMPYDGFQSHKRVLLLPLTENYDHTSGWMQPLELEDELYAMSLTVNHTAVPIPTNWNITPAKLARAVKAAPVIDITDIVMSSGSDIITLEVLFTHTSQEIQLWSGIVTCIFVEKIDLSTIADRIEHVYRDPHQPIPRTQTGATTATRRQSNRRRRQLGPNQHFASPGAAATTDEINTSAPNDNTSATVDVTGACVSLRCPLTTLPMDIPARGVFCEHLQCMDLAAVLHQCVQSNIWNCPLCDAPMRPRDICINYRLKEWITNHPNTVDDVHYIVETPLGMPLQIHMKKKGPERNETIIDVGED